MNIWMLTSEYPPDFGGGIGMYVNQAAKMFARANNDVTVIVRDPKQISIDYPEKNLRVVRFQHMKGKCYTYLGYWAALAYQFADEVISLIKSESQKPDIIEVQEYNAIGYYLLLRKWQNDEILKDIPIVVHLHTPTFELDRVNQAPRYKFPNYWLGQMEKFCMRAADALISPSKFLKDQIQQYSPNNPITVINLPYELDGYSETNNRNFESDTLLYFGRTEYRKGVSQMIKGAEALWQKGYNFKLKIIGGDTHFHPKARNLGEILKEKYSRRIEEGKLIFKAAIPPNDLNPEILNAKAVIVPSLYENFPYTCLTSMWLGAPMLVSKSGGQAEMVEENGLNGLVFDWDKKGDFENSLIKLLNMNVDDLRSMSLNSHKRIRELCNIKQNLEFRIKFFEKVIEETKASRRSVFPTLLDVIKSEQMKSVSIKKNLLSIIIPYYNLGEYLDETMESALATTYKNFEIIIINDGTTDPLSLEALIKYRNMNNVQVIDIENMGLANARNIGAEYANGEFITFLDADDLVERDFYARSINILDSYQNVSFVYCWLQYFGNSTGIWPTFNMEVPYLLGANMLSAFVIVRKSDFINFGLNKIEMEYGLEDYEGWLSMCLNGCVGVSIPEPLVKYRVRSDSMSRQFNRDMILYLRDRMSHSNVELYNQYGLEIYNLMDANGPGYLWNNPTFNYPPVGYGTPDQSNYEDMNSHKYELMRLASSKWGSRFIKLFFKLRLNKLLKKIM